jgi:ABC-type uncharacterized transport system permease subunit
VLTCERLSPMLATVAGIIAVILYLSATWFQSQNLLHDRNLKNPVQICGWIALLAHFVSMLGVINTTGGYDFGFFKISTVFSFTISGLILLSNMKKPVQNLFLLIFPFGIISILCALFVPSKYVPNESYTLGVATHIVLAILATSIITIGAVQAIFMAYENQQLRQRHHFSLIRHLPPLETMESLLFEIIWLGILLLSAVIITGIIYTEDFLGQHLSHKTVFSIGSWVVFAILLWGRHQAGWRGSTAIRWTLAGFGFLILAYFGSKFVLELVLNRA